MAKNKNERNGGGVTHMSGTDGLASVGLMEKESYESYGNAILNST